MPSPTLPRLCAFALLFLCGSYLLAQEQPLKFDFDDIPIPGDKDGNEKLEKAKAKYLKKQVVITGTMFPVMGSGGRSISCPVGRYETRGERKFLNAVNVIWHDGPEAMIREKAGKSTITVIGTVKFIRAGTINVEADKIVEIKPR